MTYAAREESKDAGLPASLFLIRHGSGPDNYFAYTDTDRPVTRAGITYEPTIIGREDVESGGTLDNSQLDIEITPKAGVVDFFLNRSPSQVVTMVIQQTHVDDPDEEVVTVWSGRIVSVEPKSRYATISCEPVSTMMRRPGLRRRYQYGCPWALYSRECGADREASKVTAPAGVVGQNLVELADGWQGEKPKEKFTAGYAQWIDDEDGSTQVRTILRVNVGAGTAGADVLIFSGKVDGLSTGQQVEIFLGCNHRMSDCKDLHDNILNFGGQPWIPKDNPIGSNGFY